MWTDCTRCQYERRNGRYTTDLTDAEFALIEPLLPPPRAGPSRGLRGQAQRHVTGWYFFHRHTGGLLRRR